MTWMTYVFVDPICLLKCALFLKVADRNSKEKATSAVYSSDLKRAVETAKIIARSCGVPEAIKDPDLRERHLGELQGLTSDEVAKLKGNIRPEFSSSRTDQEIPFDFVRYFQGGGESFDQLYQRCISALQRIGMRHMGERVIVVSGYSWQSTEGASSELLQQQLYWGRY
ncbi:hypothetical protein RJ640_020304 [Escallonia rubra]|uniref:Uncharacterized protein n=1 Tax=Escallonia rubra TaxID=112253 RepID=A0AA88US48_9ASTE|nr:hypothetical protein RJ640_020304 [Escallonia rubra]